MRRVLLGCILCGLLFWLGLSFFLTVDVPLTPAVPVADTVVILGAGYYKDGQPVPALEARLKTGILLWNIIEPKPSIVISGRKEEVRVMEQYLMSAAIPKETIIKDTNGTNTAATVKSFRGQKGCIFVSQAYHLPRMRLYAFAYKVDAEYYPAEPVPIAFWDLFPLAARESLAVLAFPFQFLFIKGYR